MKSYSGTGVSVGRGVAVGNGTDVGGGIWVGRGVAVGNGVWVGRGVAVDDGVWVGRGITVGNGVWVGVGVVVGKGVLVRVGVEVRDGKTVCRRGRAGGAVRSVKTSTNLETRPKMVLEVRVVIGRRGCGWWGGAAVASPGAEARLTGTMSMVSALKVGKMARL
jgi:NDP-sugar pyrophosphorylase family protein